MRFLPSIRIAPGGARRGLSVEQSSLARRLHCGARTEVAPITRFVRFAHCAQTGSASQFTKRAEARRLQSCAPRRSTIRPRRAPPAATLQGLCSTIAHATMVSDQGAAGWAAARMWGAEERRVGGGARSALRKLIRRMCSSAANAVSVASYTARPRPEHRKAVGAQRRPLHLSAAAHPAAPLPREEGSD